jgi:transcriptional regulator with XRE-family HTH domain
MISKALRLVRVFHDKSQTQLANELRISKSYLSEIESGKRRPSIDILERYSEIFHIPASSLLLFSEKLEDRKFSHKSRLIVADKVVKILEWVAERTDNND